VQANELCDEAMLSSLILESENIEKDLCRENINHLAPNELRLLVQINSIHQNVAKLFRLDTKSLFNVPYHVSVREMIFGPFISTGGKSGISMGIYPKDDYQMDLSVYVHEFGHFLTASKNINLPTILKHIGHSSMLNEAFSDLLALTVTGNLITPSKTPNCLDRLRYISTSQTYDYPQGYFEDFSEARIRTCCNSLMKNPREEKVTNFCELSQDYFSSDFTLGQHFNPIPNLDIDTHQIGIPLLSFFRNFKEKANIQWKNVFDKIVFPEVEADHELYLCTLKDGDQYPIKVQTIGTILEQFKASLSPTEKNLYRLLYKKHALFKGIQYSRLEVPKQAASILKDNLECKNRNCQVECILEEKI